MSDDDITVEPIPGLPAHLPEGEQVLWQGRPSTWALARQAFGLYWVVGYFGVLAGWRWVAAMAEFPASQALGAAIPMVGAGLLAGAILVAMAWVQARETIYTLTTDRVVMRVGAALTLTLNLPYREILDAHLALRPNGTGTIALATKPGPARLSYLACWPHVRPWHVRVTEPALRCIPDAERIAELFAEAASKRVNKPEVEQRQNQPAVAAE